MAQALSPKILVFAGSIRTGALSQKLANVAAKELALADADVTKISLSDYSLPFFNGDIEKALRSITAPLLYMPSETDLYFPLGDAKYEAQFIKNVKLMPIPSLWGHPAGAGASPEDKKFLNDNIARFLAGG